MFWRFGKVPFTCSYFAGKTSLSILAALYLYGFTTYAFNMADLEKALATKMAKKVDVMVRSAPELRDVLKGNPFPEKEPAKVAVAFLGEAPPKDLLKRVVAPGGELVKPGRREVYVYYPEGMGRSKLKLPLEGPATVRNVNTVAKLVAMMDEVKQA